MKRKVIMALLPFLLVLAVPVALFLAKNPLFTHADASTQDASIKVTIQGYGYSNNTDGENVQSNTAAIAYPHSGGFDATRHDVATEGEGTYDDPITFAAYTPLTEGEQAIFAPGTMIYVPYLRKYFILEDSCDDCDQGLNETAYKLNLWLGPSSPTEDDTPESIEECIAQIAQLTVSIIINPTKDYKPSDSRLYTDGACSIHTYSDEAIKGSLSAHPPDGSNGAPPPAVSTDEEKLTVAVTSYGYPDNDDGEGHYNTAVIAFPKVSYPTKHDVATEGDGSYNDPITFAAFIGDTDEGQTFPPGTMIYVPYLQKFFILEDQCADCDDVTAGNAFHIDLWMGPSSPGELDTSDSIQDCEAQITHDSEEIILHPIDDESIHPVDKTPLYEDGDCTAVQH